MFFKRENVYFVLLILDIEHNRFPVKIKSRKMSNHSFADSSFLLFSSR